MAAADLGDPTRIAPRTERWLPHALIATSLVVVVPALAVWTIVPADQVALLALSVPLGMLLSVLAASLGGALWKRTPGSRDVVFADLMIWGWLRRLRAERRLAHAEMLLGGYAQGLSVETLIELSALLEARDAHTYGHSQRVTRHAERIARAMGLSDSDVAKVRTAAALHDVGKLKTPRAILYKPGRLTDDERAVMKRHAVDGAAMAAGLGDPAITAIIRHHHERIDGRGYPAGLAGEEIPLGSRIIAVADTFDVMTSNRAYRRASSHKRALDVLRSEAGTQLDRAAVAGFAGYYRGRRTVAWSAFVTAAPQRFLAWLGGASSGIGAGAAGAAALAIGLGTSPAPVLTPAAAAAQWQPGHRVKAAEPKRAGDKPVAVLGDAPAERSDRSARRSPPTSQRQATPRTANPHSVKPKRVRPPKAAKPHPVTPPAADPNRPEPKPVRPPRVKPPTAKPQKVKPPTVKPVKVKPPAAQPPKAKPPTPHAPAVAPPTATPPKVKPPTAHSPAVTPAAAAPPKAGPPAASVSRPAR